jgi:protein involved in polysaccharide export with SLBB domain
MPSELDRAQNTRGWRAGDPPTEQPGRGANRIRILVIVCLALFLGCARPAPAQLSRAVAASTSGSTSQGAQSDVTHVAPAQRDVRYKICREDVLAISFELTPNLDQKVTVQPDGYISLRGAGNIRVEGLTLAGAVEAIKKAYESRLHDPIIDVDLLDAQKAVFTVLGQVGKPGQYDLRYDTTVTQAIALAGGFSESAKTQVFLYRAVSADWAEVRELKLKDILHGKKINEDVHLRPGDMIFVPEKWISNFRKYVPYGIGTGISPNI